MKKSILLFAVVVLFSLNVNAQSTYTTALGLGIDFGSGATFVGPSVKHFFSEHHAGQGEVTFEDGVTALTALYQYHDNFEGASGLQWFGGGGVSIFLFDGGSVFGLRGTLGLDYKINDVPLAFSFDWRPILALDSDVNDRFEAGAFGFGARYTFN